MYFHIELQLQVFRRLYSEPFVEFSISLRNIQMLAFEQGDSKIQLTTYYFE